MATPKFRIKDIISPGYPLLEANRTIIESIERRTQSYGPTEDHQLDVYYPPSAEAQVGNKPPILVFFYGGGFANGARSNPPQNLVHNNLGAFFALNGILTVVADYRRVPRAVFPQGAEDVRDALLWVIEHVSEGDSSRLFVIGHSAGGVHVASMILLPSLFSPPLVEAIRGVILLGVPYEISNDHASEFRKAAEIYYESTRKLAVNQPLGLLRRATPEYIAASPPLRNVMSESEPRRIKSANRVFLEMYRHKGGNAEDFILEGHDHLSPILALSSGTGEEWGEDSVKWIKEILKAAD